MCVRVRTCACVCQLSLLYIHMKKHVKPLSRKKNHMIVGNPLRNGSVPEYALGSF